MRLSLSSPSCSQSLSFPGTPCASSLHFSVLSCTWSSTSHSPSPSLFALVRVTFAVGLKTFRIYGNSDQLWFFHVQRICLHFSILFQRCGMSFHPHKTIMCFVNIPVNVYCFRFVTFLAVGCSKYKKLARGILFSLFRWVISFLFNFFFSFMSSRASCMGYQKISTGFSNSLRSTPNDL